ncbi:hypothetical protein EVAR_59475_1 [Eumeta japonica]|uniref:Uncharacterized protein n=1 Tax=Eumeta variegata TaxID=151549 RepID=A0A4C1Z202_EUMVA|nr:hypothetical protein EVAR_59475_1 [Eumeta japonica]
MCTFQPASAHQNIGHLFLQRSSHERRTFFEALVRREDCDLSRVTRFLEKARALSMTAGFEKYSRRSIRNRRRTVVLDLLIDIRYTVRVVKAPALKLRVTIRPAPISIAIVPRRDIDAAHSIRNLSRSRMEIEWGAARGGRAVTPRLYSPRDACR